MDFRVYQKNASKTFKQHPVLNEQQAQLMDWLLGLLGESGEFAEHIKHHLFHGESLNKLYLAKELGDILWYLTALATTLKISLADIATLNLAKLDFRYSSGFNAAQSATRHENEKVFEQTMLYKQLADRIMKEGTMNSNLNVIFVGPDGAGKTTLATSLAKKLQFDYYKGTFKEENKYELTKQLISRRNTIFDRFYFPDEIIYRQVKGDPVLFTEIADFYALAPVMKAGGFRFIYVTASLATLTERVATRGDGYVKSSDLAKILELYDAFFKHTNIPFIRIDTTDEPAEVLLDRLLTQYKFWPGGKE